MAAVVGDDLDRCLQDALLGRRSLEQEREIHREALRPPSVPSRYP
jgi:hypothetical protein